MASESSLPPRPRPYDPHASPRDLALALIQELPSDVSFEQLLGELQKEHCITQGLEDLEAGRTLTVQELRRQLTG